MSQIIQFPISNRAHPWVRTRDRAAREIWGALEARFPKEVRNLSKKERRACKDSMWCFAGLVANYLKNIEYTNEYFLENCKNASEAFIETFPQLMEECMADLAGRKSQPKAEWIAEERARKAARKGETNAATKRKITRTAERAAAGKINIEAYVKFAEGQGLDPEKVRAFCKAKLDKWPNVSNEDFNQWLNEASKRGDFNP